MKIISTRNFAERGKNLITIFGIYCFGNKNYHRFSRNSFSWCLVENGFMFPAFLVVDGGSFVCVDI
jgi:hypothetical protein